VIRVVFAFFARALLDFALVLVFSGVLLIVLAFRTVRRFATPAPDKLDKVSAQLAQLLTIGLVASRRAGSAGGDKPELDYLDELTDEEAEESVDFWRSVVV
jgi:hypothetical protein